VKEFCAALKPTVQRGRRGRDNPSQRTFDFFHGMHVESRRVLNMRRFTRAHRLMRRSENLDLTYLA